MTQIQIPAGEIDLMISLLSQAFRSQKRVRILRSQVTYQLVLPRSGYQFGFEIRQSPVSILNVLLRVYVKFDPQDRINEVSLFQVEETQTPREDGSYDSVNVATAIFTRTQFPVLSKVYILEDEPEPVIIPSFDSTEISFDSTEFSWDML